MSFAELTSTLERTVLIQAERATVFRYFTDSERFARWWGAGSTIEARPGGALRIRYPNGVEAAGTVLEVVAGERITFSYGYASGQPIPPGSSRVTITVADHPRGTLVRLEHAFEDPAVRDAHVQGWRFQLSLFSIVVSDEQHAGAALVADRWFEAWADPDAASRRARLAACAVEQVSFRDRYSCTRGIDDLSAHIGAAQVHLKGVAIRRDGEPRHCQGTLLVNWIMTRADGAEAARGTNVFSMAPGGKIAEAVGLW